jgi:uncharacterized protein (UPF0332 family)
MSLEELLRDRIIEKIKANKNEAEKIFKLAKRDLKVAKNLFVRGDYDWALAVAYNAMLQSGRALMLKEGYRPFSQYKHVAVVRFVHEAFGKQIDEMTTYVFNKMRKKRHRVVYEEPDIVSKDEARQSIKWAEEFVEEMEKILKE